MGSHNRAGWLARTFGWSGTRREWLGLLGVLAWVVGAVLLARAARTVSTGQGVLLAAGWLLLLGLFARDFVRHLFGPVFFYEVVRIGRRRATFLGRGFFAVAMTVGLGLFYLDWLAEHRHQWADGRKVGTQLLSRFGSKMFEMYAVVQFLVVAFLTPVYVAGAVSVEKERKTLEFLFATDLRNAEIVFGKVAARVGVLLLYVLAGLPVVGMLQLFGGVDPEQLLAAFAVTVVTVIGLSALSIWFSCQMRRPRDAIVLTYMAALVYFFGSVFAAGFSNFTPAGWWNTPVDFGLFKYGLNDALADFATGNPLWQLIILSASGRAGGPGPVTFAVGLGDAVRTFATFWAVASVLLLGHAILTLRAVTLRQAYGPPPGIRTRRKKVIAKDGTETTVRVNVLPRVYPDIGANPVFWKEVFVDGSRSGLAFKIFSGLVLAFIFFIPGLIVWNTWIDPSPWMAGRTLSSRWNYFTDEMNGWVRGVTGVIGTLMFFGTAVRGAGAVSGEKDRDTWISLISTPMTADAMLWGKWWGCVLGQRRPIALLVLVWCIGLTLGAVSPLAVPLLLAATVLFVSMFAWVGLYCSMTARNTLNASVKAFFAALFCTGGFWLLILMCCAFPLSLARSGSERGTETLFKMFAGGTPSFVYGWLPVRSFERRDMEPFDSHYRNDGDNPGLAAPIVGLVVWSGLNVIAATVCLTTFRRLTNRVPDRLPGERPPPAGRASGGRQPPEPTTRGEPPLTPNGERPA